MASIKRIFNAFASGKTWEQKVYSGDALWRQVSDLLAKDGATLPATPRRPDVRLIVNNLTGRDLSFKNPGDHAGSQMEKIPATGDSRAVMIMLAGDDLATQQAHAQTLVDRYALDTRGLTDDFLADMAAGRLSSLLAEAYGPAPFDAQAKKLADVSWAAIDGTVSTLTPSLGAAAAFGARPATAETVFLVRFPLYVRGTTTTAELVESEGMAVAVSEDWQTKAVTTRPIVASVARSYYGSFFDSIPVAYADADGTVARVEWPEPVAPTATPAAPLTPPKR